MRGTARPSFTSAAKSRKLPACDTREHGASEQEMAVSAADYGLVHVLGQLEDAVVFLLAPHSVVLEGMNRPAVPAQKLFRRNLAAPVLAPGNQRVVQHHQASTGAQYFEQIVQPFRAGCRLKTGMGFRNAGLGQTRDSQVEEIVLKAEGQLLAERIAVRIRGTLPQQFNTPGNFVMVGNPQMDTVEAERGDA